MGSEEVPHDACSMIGLTDACCVDRCVHTSLVLVSSVPSVGSIPSCLVDVSLFLSCRLVCRLFSIVIRLGLRDA